MSFGVRLEPGRVIGGDYVVVAPLAEGGMGAVYVVEQRSTGRRRALKVMHPAIAADGPARERFAREAQVGSRIESEHVIEVLAAGVDHESGLPWLAMELLEGGSLMTLVEQRGPVPVADLVQLFRQLCHALSAAHRVGVVHRDLKPENVFIAASRRSDAPFTVKVLDFGIAKLVQGATSAGNSQLIGSPLWMAPEQLSPQSPIGPTTDVWALGLVAFFLLTGRSYWLAAAEAAPSVQVLIAEMVVSPLVPASVRAAALGVADRVPPRFDPWFARLIARDPNERFASVELLLAELERLAAQRDEPSSTAAPRPIASSPIAPTVAAVAHTPSRPVLGPSGHTPIAPTVAAIAQTPSRLVAGSSGHTPVAPTVAAIGPYGATPAPVPAISRTVSPRQPSSAWPWIGGGVAVVTIASIATVVVVLALSRDAGGGAPVASGAGTPAIALDDAPTPTAPSAAHAPSAAPPAPTPHAEPATPTPSAPNAASPTPTPSGPSAEQGTPASDTAEVTSDRPAPVERARSVSRGTSGGVGSGTARTNARSSGGTSGGTSGAAPIVDPYRRTSVAPGRARASASEIQAAVARANPSIRACAAGRTGRAQVRMTIAGSTGRVTTAMITGGPFAGTPEGSCMVRAIRSTVRVQPFSDPAQTIAYPFNII